MVAITQAVAAAPVGLTQSAGPTTASADVQALQAKLTTALLNALSANPSGVTATVLAAPQGDKALLALAGQTVEASITKGSIPTAALQPGARLQFVANQALAGQTPTLRFVSFQPPSAADATTAGLSTAINTPSISVVASTALAPAQAPQKPQTALATQPQTPLKGLLTEAITRQTGPGALLTTLQTALTDTKVPVPPRVAELGATLLGLSLDLDQPVTSQSVREAIANWTQPTTDGSTPRLNVPPAQVLLRLLAATAQPASLPEATKPDQQTPQSAAPPPPGRETDPLLHPRSNITESIAKLTPEQKLATIANEAERSNDRMVLHQAAPLPTDAVRQQTDLPRQLVQSFDLPMMLAGQPMISPFRVERDAPDRARKQGEEAAWSIRFAIDISVLGPVHAHLRLQPMGRQAPRLSMTLWAEQTESHDALTTLRDTLEADLADNGFAPGDLTILAGKPAAMPQHTKPGQMLDRNS